MSDANKLNVLNIAIPSVIVPSMEERFSPSASNICIGTLKNSSLCNQLSTTTGHVPYKTDTTAKSKGHSAVK